MRSTNPSPTPAVAPPVGAASQPVDLFTDLDAERWLLAAFLHDPATLADFREPLFLPDFSRLAPRCILDACFSLRRAFGSFTAQSLINQLQPHDHCDAVAVAQALLEPPPPAAAAAAAAFDRHSELANGAHRIARQAQHRQLLRWLEAAPERLRRTGKVAPLQREAASLFTAITAAVVAPPMTGYHGALRRFLGADLKAAEELFSGLHRREIGELLADEAQGKTALLLQLALSLAAGEAQAPVLAAAAAPRRVVYVNGDAAASRLHEELEKVVPQLENQAAALENFRLLFEAEWYGEGLRLYEAADWQRLATWIRQQEPDFVILDGVAALDPKQSKPSQRREQGAKVFARLRELAKQTNCAILVAHSTITNGNRRRLGNAIFAAADSVYHFRSDHRYGDDYRRFRCVQSRWTLPPVLGLQRNPASGGYEVAAEGTGEAASHAAKSPKNQALLLELVEYLGEGWEEPPAITQHFEGRARLSQVKRLIHEAYLYGWIRKQALNLPWQVAKRGLDYLAEKKAREAEETAAAKNRAPTIAEGEAVSTGSGSAPLAPHHPMATARGSDPDRQKNRAPTTDDANEPIKTNANANANADGNKNFRAPTTDDKNFRGDSGQRAADRVQNEPPLGSL